VKILRTPGTELRLVFATEWEHVYYSVRNKLLNVILVNLSLQSPTSHGGGPGSIPSQLM
jgi:hypothetical protein